MRTLPVCASLMKGAIAAAVLSLASTAAGAAPLYFDFDTRLGPFEAVEVSLDNGALEGPFTPRTPRLGGQRVLRLRDLNIHADGGAPSRFLVVPQRSFENPSVSALVNTTGRSNDSAGVLARGSIETLSAYAAAIDFAANRIVLTKTVGGVITVVDDAYDILPTGNDTYLVNLVVRGSQSTARFFDATGSTLLGRLAYEDADPLPPGFVGLEAEISAITFPAGDDAVDTTFDNLTAAEVPVPASVWLVGLGLASLIALPRRRIFRRAHNEGRTCLSGTPQPRGSLSPSPVAL